MNLCELDVIKAAKIAASKFGSSDPAISHDDLISAATLRICERDPLTIGAAVHVGREGISRIIGQVRYTKEATTARGVETHVDARPAQSARPSTALKKRRRFAADLIRRIGRPVFLFGKFGVAYPDAIEPKLAGVWFDDIGDALSSPKRLTIKVVGPLNAAVKRLAEFHHVLLLVTDAAEEKVIKENVGQNTQAKACDQCSCVATCRRGRALSAA